MPALAQTTKKYAPDARPAVARGIPAKVVDAILMVVAIDEQDITPDSVLVEDLGMDSLDLIELMLHLEDAYRVSLEDDVHERLETGATVAQLVKDLRSAGAAL